MEIPPSESEPCQVGGHWYNVHGDTKYLICHLASQNHVTDVSSNFKNSSSSWCFIALPSLVTIGIVEVGI